MRLPVFLVAGIAEAPMSAAALSLQCDLPQAVVVRHDIDSERRVLTRTIADITGILEREDLTLDHLCITCAVREDIVPTLLRLADIGRWEAIVAHLPVAAEPHSVCRALHDDAAARDALRVAAVVSGLEAATLRADLTGDDLLVERSLATADTDRRGVAEVTASIVEYSDQTTLFGAADSIDRAFVTALARPGARVVTDDIAAGAREMLHGIHDHEVSEAWVDEVRRDAMPGRQPGGVWSLDLCSTRPLHPQRLLREISALGAGGHRSRGCFYLPSRPGVVCGWAGAGGALSIGTVGSWGDEEPITRIVLYGIDDGGGSRVVAARRQQIQEAYERTLLTDAELAMEHVRSWRGGDGFESWLGPIARAA